MFGWTSRNGGIFNDCIAYRAGASDQQLRKLSVSVLAIALCSSPTIAAKFTMQLSATPTQSVRMQSGIAAVDDTASGSSVRLIQADGDLKKRGTVELIVMNHGAMAFNFGPESVAAALSDGTPIEIITYERLAREEKKRQTWAAVAAGLGAMGRSMSASSAGYYSGTATYRGTTQGSFGSTPFNSRTYGTGTVSGYNAGQAQIAQSIANAQNQADFARMAEQNASRMGALKAYMRTTTVDPQQMFGGSVMFELPKSIHKGTGDVPISFVVTVNGAVHRFNAVLKRR